MSERTFKVGDELFADTVELADRRNRLVHDVWVPPRPTSVTAVRIEREKGWPKSPSPSIPADLWAVELADLEALHRLLVRAQIRFAYLFHALVFELPDLGPPSDKDKVNAAIEAVAGEFGDDQLRRFGLLPE